MSVSDVGTVNATAKPRFSTRIKKLSSKKAVRLLIKVLAAFVIVLLVVGIFHSWILDKIGTFMAVRDPIEKSDLIVVDDNQGHWNPFAAAGLYQKGYAPIVAIPRQRLSRIEQLDITGHKEELCRQVLESRGVPADKIIFLGQDLKDDADLGRALGEYAKSQNIKSVIVATTPAMSRLSRADLRRGLGDQSLVIRMYPARTRHFDEHNWWHVRQGWVTFFDAYFLWILHSFAR